MSTYTIVLVPPARCREAWCRAKKHLKRAIATSKGRWEPEYVLAALVLDEQQLWVVLDSTGDVVGVSTTAITVYPERKILTVHFLGGDDFDIWYKQLLDTLGRFAKDSGCDAIECVARFGFWKWFQQDGFKKTSAFYEKLL